MLKGLRLSVYRAVDFPDCTNGGISGTHARVTVVGRLVDGVVMPLPLGCCVFEADDDAPAVVLVESHCPRYDPTPHLIPLEFVDGTPVGSVGPMSGGNYAGTTDSRWSELGKLYEGVRHLDAVAIHDRIETAAQYRALSV
jgi:hypothetical protein